MRDALAEGKLPYIERLPPGTSRTDGHTFAEAKRLLNVEMREARDYWAEACVRARKLTRERLSITDIPSEGDDDGDGDGENLNEDGSESGDDPREATPAPVPARITVPECIDDEEQDERED